MVPRLRIARCATCVMAQARTGKCRAIIGEVSSWWCRVSAPIRTASAVLAHVGQIRNAVDVDQRRGPQQTEIEHRHEALSARDDLRVAGGLRQRRDRHLDRVRRRHTRTRPASCGDGVPCFRKATSREDRPLSCLEFRQQIVLQRDRARAALDQPLHDAGEPLELLRGSVNRTRRRSPCVESARAAPARHGPAPTPSGSRVAGRPRRSACRSGRASAAVPATAVMNAPER